MNVRSFQLGDYASVTSLLSNVLSAECYEETMEAFAKQLSWDCELVLVAQNDQGIVGIIIGTIDNNEGYYYRIAVDTEYQRQGYGKMLVQGLQQKFVQRNVNSIKITADTHNEPVFPLYEALGFHTKDFCSRFQKLKIVN
jgi:ribosomal protein S18 acetylase RimI-like enzyme